MDTTQMMNMMMAAVKSVIAAMAATPPNPIPTLYGATLSAAGITATQGSRADEGYFTFSNGVILHVQYLGQGPTAGGSYVTTGIYYDNNIDGWVYGSNGQWGHFKIVT